MFKINMKKYFQLFCLTSILLASGNTLANSSNPFSVTEYGNFSKIMEMREAPGIVSLQPMQGNQHLYGLGALQSMHGEVTIIDGKLLVSRGTANDGHISKVTPQDSAAFLATAIVKNWIAVPIPPNLNQASFEKFVLVAISKAGISNNVPFPFLVKGEIKNLQWHVISAISSDVNTNSFHPEKKQFNTSSTTGILVGFYSGKQLEGIISHKGNLFHIHFTDKSLHYSGHVDQFEIGSNTTLFLPQT